MVVAGAVVVVGGTVVVVGGVVVVVGGTVVVVVVVGGAVVVVVVVGGTVVVVGGTVVVVVGGLVVGGDVVTVVVVGVVVTVTVTGAESTTGIAAVAWGNKLGWRSEATLGRVTFLTVTFLPFSVANPVRNAANCSRKGTGRVCVTGAVVVVVGTVPDGSATCGAVVEVVVGAIADTLAV